MGMRRHGPRQMRRHITRKKWMTEQRGAGAPNGYVRCGRAGERSSEHRWFRVVDVRERVRARGGSLERFGPREWRAASGSRSGKARIRVR